MAAVLLTTALFAALLMHPTTAEAKTVSASDTYSGDLYYRSTAVDWKDGYYQGLVKPHATVHYHLDVRNVDEGTLLAEGASVPVGTVLRFESRLGDISWVGTGKTVDTPTGSWVPGAALGESTYVSDGYQIGQCRSQNYIGKIKNFINTDESYNVYIPFSVNPPAQSVNVTGTAGLTALGGNQYRVDSPGTIFPAVTFGDTSGRYYYQVVTSARGCTMSWDVTPILDGSLLSAFPLRYGYSGTRTITTNPTPYIYNAQFSSKTIDYYLTAVGDPAPTNNPPTNPSLTVAAQVPVGNPYTINFVSTDPDGDTLYYEVDWNYDGTADQRVPSSGYVAEGVSQSATRTWSTSGNRDYSPRR